MKRLTRSTTDRMISGVLGGLAEYFKVDTTLLRLIFAILTLMSIFTLVFIYFVAMIIIPSDQELR
ncbi:PspC domain-containing protein [Virgibacillus sp. DJP39]|uniref:PspC domain-containing protein n=1 Tax=Virgibacillus sp. DJP39 TaxID=3409790 RepID=UPI003BB594AF